MDAKKNQEQLIGATAVGKELNLSDAKVKKLITELNIEPAAKRGICNFYSRDTIAKIHGEEATHKLMQAMSQREL